MPGDTNSRHFNYFQLIRVCQALGPQANLNSSCALFHTFSDSVNRIRTLLNTDQLVPYSPFSPIELLFCLEMMKIDIDLHSV